MRWHKPRNTMYPNHLDEFDAFDWILLAPCAVMAVTLIVYLAGNALGFWA